MFGFIIQRCELHHKFLYLVICHLIYLGYNFELIIGTLRVMIIKMFLNKSFLDFKLLSILQIIYN